MNNAIAHSETLLATDLDKVGAIKIAACGFARIVYGPEFIALGYVAGDWQTAKLMISIMWAGTVAVSILGLVACSRRFCGVITSIRSTFGGEGHANGGRPVGRQPARSWIKESSPGFATGISRKRRVIGIGPIDGVSIPVREIDYNTGQLRFASPDGKLSFEYDDGTLTVTDASG